MKEAVLCLRVKKRLLGRTSDAGTGENGASKGVDEFYKNTGKERGGGGKYIQERDSRRGRARFTCVVFLKKTGIRGVSSEGTAKRTLAACPGGSGLALKGEGRGNSALHPMPTK